jgi:hypothetical protein
LRHVSHDDADDDSGGGGGNLCANIRSLPSCRMTRAPLNNRMRVAYIVRYQWWAVDDGRSSSGGGGPNLTMIENVQRRFTKYLPGLSSLPYHQRLAKLNLESLELRRLRIDLVLLYKILFGIICTDIIKYLKSQY